MIRVGPAGWTYQDWAGVVYPKPRPRDFDPLELMATLFDTVEINSSFYAPMRVRNAQAWLARTHARRDFRFTAKLWRRFTHERGGLWTAGEVRQARAGLDVLHDAGRLGAVLVQFPWSFRHTEENREWLDALVADFQELPLVLEVRHASWDEPRFWQELAERGLGIANLDQPLFRHSLEPGARATSAVGYVRVHGRNYRNWFRQEASPLERYDYLYSARELKPWVTRTREIAAHPRVEDVYVITNNHARGKGVANALMLQSMIRGEPVRAPDTLVREYPEALTPYVLPPEPGASEGPPAGR